jgi:hypothetical protein
MEPQTEINNSLEHSQSRILNRMLAMKRMSFYLVVILCVIVLVSCVTKEVVPVTSPPTIVNHPEPNYGINESQMIQDIAELGGCDDADFYDRILCPQGSTIYALGCEELSNQISYPGLKPYPVFTCFRDSELSGFAQIQPSGGYYGEFTYDGDKFLLIKKMSEYQKFFTPIDSVNEALSYALAFTTQSWMATEFAPYNLPTENAHFTEQYGMKPHADYKYYTKKIESTFVKETGDGCIVHLFLDIIYYYDECKTDTYAVDILVKSSGEMSIIEPGPQLNWRETSCPMP